MSCTRESVTPSRLLGEPGRPTLIVDCSVHGEIGRVPAELQDGPFLPATPVGDGLDEYQRVEQLWTAHVGG